MTITNITLTLDEPIDVTTPETATVGITAIGFTDFNIRVFAQPVDATGAFVGSRVDLGGISSITNGGTSSAPVALNVAGLDPTVDYRFYAEDTISTTTSALTTPLDVTCFAAGTRIATARGEVPVESLRIGDLVVTAEGGAPLKPIRWIGHSRVNVARQPDRGRAAPILITAGALADGVPHRDLRVSPEHALFLDGALVPARLLVNGTTIVQEAWCAEVTYWHVELEGHGLLVSEGAVSESYFDDGNRHFFDNHAITALVKDFAGHRANGRYRAAACAPVLDDGPALGRIRQRLNAREAMAAAPQRASA